MESEIYLISKLKRISAFPYPLDEIGIMVNHCVEHSQMEITRYFFCFSFNKDKYCDSGKDLRPTFGILPPGTVMKYNKKLLHDELFFSYPEKLNARISALFPSLEGNRYSAVFYLNDDFNSDLLKLKGLLIDRNTLGVADKLDALAMKMIMSVYADSLQSNDKLHTVSAEARIQEIAIKLKNGENLNTLLRKYGYSRRAFYYEWNKNFSVSPKHIRLAVKLEQAQKLLMISNLSICEIAERCEFSSHRYFHECFLKYFKMTPGDYRKRFQAR